MALSHINTAIRTHISAVSGIGNVYGYYRLVTTREGILSVLVKNNIINAWMVSRRSTPAERAVLPAVHRHHTMRITGFYGLDDSAATETTFQALVEAVQTSLDNDLTMGGYAVNSGPASVLVVDLRMIGSYLCHYTEIDFPVTERVYYHI